MQLQFKHTSLASMGILSLIIAVVGCQDPDYPTPQPSTAGYNTTSTRVLFVNATPNAQLLTFLIENNLAGQPLAPNAASTYNGVPLGSAQIRVKGAGGTLGSNDIASKPTLAANTAYTIFATDTITRPLTRNATTNAVTDPGGIRTVQVNDTLTAPPAGNARIRVFNFAPDVTAASVRLVNPSTSQGAAVFPNRAYRNVAGTNLRYTTVPAGAYTAQIYTATSAPASTTAPTAATSTVTLADGKIYTLYVSGLNRSKTLGLGIVQHN